MVDIDDLITPLTVAEIKASIYSVLLALGVTTTSWKPGAVTRAIITALAVVLAGMSALQASIARSGFLDTSTRDWLTLKVKSDYGEDRQGATFATGTVELTNATVGTFNISAREMIVTDTVGTKQFRNVSAFTLLGSATNFEVAVEGVEQGAINSAQAGEVVNILAPSMPSVTVANTSAITAVDAESDVDLRVRAREKLGALSPSGPWDAYSHVAKAAKNLNGQAIGINRVHSISDGAGTITSYVAKATGEVAGTVGDTATDLGKVEDDMQQLAVPLGLTLNVHSATAVAIDVTYQIWVYSSLSITDAELIAQCDAAIAVFINTRPLGGDSAPPVMNQIFVDAIEAAIGCVRPNDTIRVIVSLPTDHVVLAVNEVALPGTLNGAVTRVRTDTIQ